MKRRDPRRVLAIALALSLLVHAIVAIVLRPARPAVENEAERVTIEHRSAIALQTPVPKPPPQHTPPPRPRASTIPAKPAATPGRQALPGAPSERGTAAPQPTPTPAASTASAPTPPPCRGNDLGAAVVGDAPQPEIPLEARAEGTSGTAIVAVRLDAAGSVVSASVAQSTGNSSLDLVAVTMARAARYRAATHDCNAVASSYRYSVKFAAW